jgi:hypothetical protein
MVNLLKTSSYYCFSIALQSGVIFQIIKAPAVTDWPILVPLCFKFESSGGAIGQLSAGSVCLWHRPSRDTTLVVDVHADITNHNSPAIYGELFAIEFAAYYFI